MIFDAFSIHSLNVRRVRLLSLILRERQISWRPEPLATTRGEKVGPAGE